MKTVVREKKILICGECGEPILICDCCERFVEYDDEINCIGKKYKRHTCKFCESL